MRFFIGELLHQFGNRGHTRTAADENHFVNVAGRQTRIGKRAQERLTRALEQTVRDFLKLGARNIEY